MTYENYLDYSREELLEKVRAVMSPENAQSLFWVLSELLWLWPNAMGHTKSRLA